MMANTTNPEDSVEGTEIYSTEAVEDALLEESALENSDSLLSVLTNLNQNMDHMRWRVHCLPWAKHSLLRQSRAPNEARRSLWEFRPFKGENEED